MAFVNIQAKAQDRCFLLVEDFEVMRGVLKGLLLRCGAKRVDTAASGREAVALLRKNSYDAVMCDYNLGEGKSGQMLLEEARHHGWVTPATVWIMITAEKTSDMVAVAAEDAPDEYLLKPITEAALQGRMDKLIERKASLAPIAKAMRHRDWRAALKLCEEQLASGCKAPAEVMRIQADLCVRLGDYAKAQAAYQVVLQRAAVPWAKLGLANVLMLQKQSQAARGLLQEVIRDHPQYLEAYDTYAQLLAAEGQHRQQLAVLERAAQISPNAPSRQAALGHAALKQGDTEMAAAAFKKALKLGEHSDIERLDPYLGLARIHTETGAPDQAQKVLQDLRARFDSERADVMACAEEVRLHRATGNTAAAEALAKQVCERAQDPLTALDPEASVRLAQVLMEAGQVDQASDLLGFVTRNNHDDEAVVRRAQQVFDAAGLADRGAELLATARRQATESMSEGVRLMAQGDLAGALESLRGAKLSMPQNARVLLNFAAVALTALDKGTASGLLIGETRDCLAAAARLRPGDDRVRQLGERLKAHDPFAMG